MEKTFCARFGSHQEAMEAMHEVQSRFPDVKETSESRSTFDESNTSVISSKNFWNGSMGGVFMPSYMTNPLSAESSLANNARGLISDMGANQAYELKFKAGDENGAAITNILEQSGGARIQIL